MRHALGIAVLGAATVLGSFCGPGRAHAALGTRADDPVVLRGSVLTPLLGADPARIAAYRWTSGAWDRVPVQVDERHTISARRLYPDAANGYVGGPNGKTFDLEVYADPKTRSGADADPSFDTDDELVFMGGDAGTTAPGTVAAPGGVDGAGAVEVDVTDHVTGGAGTVYLFEAPGAVDPSAAGDYVRYDFRLTGLQAGETLLEDYGYVGSSNPEDSRVVTDAYELHSFDRWMEDELKVKAGGASRVDILDREVAQATRTNCGRSEFTFSGHYGNTSAGTSGDMDTEGAYIAVKDGPVRALRSYVGANSGPYVQREHVYYATHEVNTIFLRVHPMPDLYTWTDFAPSAIGMTYRDSKNVGGRPVDGIPDTLTPATSADFVGGARVWQQLSGPQGSVSTVFGMATDIVNPNFASYQLDDATPTASNVQCGGDGKSIGSSGVGILGTTTSAITPNTDPRSGTFNRLQVQRTRFFGPPSDGTAQAAAYAARVRTPLTATASARPMRPVAVIPVSPAEPPTVRAKARLKLRMLTKRKARKGRIHRLRIKVANTGGSTARKVKVCVRSTALSGRHACRTLRRIGAGKARRIALRKRVRAKAKGRRLRLKITARSASAHATRRVVVRYRR